MDSVKARLTWIMYIYLCATLYLMVTNEGFFLAGVDLMTLPSLIVGKGIKNRLHMEFRIENLITNRFFEWNEQNDNGGLFYN